MRDSGTDDQTELTSLAALGAGQTLPADGDVRAAPRQALGPGDQVGRYQILRTLGAGATGTVYAAHDPQLDREIALKVLHRSTDEGFARLLREAQALARLDSPHVVAVYDSGADDGRLFIAMRLFAGTTLDRHLEQARPSGAEILRLFSDAGRGLIAAHAANIVHRDFKPANVLVDRQGGVAVTDFGLATVGDVAPEAGDGSYPTSGPGQAKLTRVGAMVGSPAFMAPELHLGRPATAASDQFAFAVSLWEALFQRHPFISDEIAASGSLIACSVAMTSSEFQPPRAGHGVPTRVERALRRALAREPAQRWPTVAALLAELQPRTKRSAWPWVAGALAVAALGTGVWWRTRATASPDHCVKTSVARFESVWAAPVADRIAARFAATELSYATPANAALRRSLDDYGTRWRALEADRCRAQATAPSALNLARAACLDRAHETVGSLVRYLETAPAGDTVGRIDPLTSTLPPLRACSDTDRLLGQVGTAPAGIAAQVRQAEAQLTEIAMLRAGGAVRQAEARLAEQRATIAAVPWPPLAAHLAIADADAALEASRAPSDDVAAGLTAALADASTRPADRIQAELWLRLLETAGQRRERALVKTAATLGLAAADHLGDTELAFAIDVARGRAQLVSGDRAAGLATCKARYAQRDQLTELAATVRDRAATCVVEAFTAMNLWGELDAFLAEELPRLEREAGDSHPRLVRYLQARSWSQMQRGVLDAAGQDIDRAVTIATRAYGPAHPRTWAARVQRARVALWAERYDDAWREAIAVRDETAASAASDEATALAPQADAEAALGMIAFYRSGKSPPPDDDLTAAIEHNRRAVELLVRDAGADSPEVAQARMYFGQYLADRDFEAGAAELREAVRVLDRARDPRVHVVRTALAIRLETTGRYQDAAPWFEASLAADLSHIEPYNRGTFEFAAARTFHALGRPTASIRALLVQAKQHLSAAGNAGAIQLRALEVFASRLER